MMESKWNVQKLLAPLGEPPCLADAGKLLASGIGHLVKAGVPETTLAELAAARDRLTAGGDHEPDLDPRPLGSKLVRAVSPLAASAQAADAAEFAKGMRLTRIAVLLVLAGRAAQRATVWDTDVALLTEPADLDFARKVIEHDAAALAQFKPDNSTISALAGELQKCAAALTNAVSKELTTAGRDLDKHARSLQELLAAPGCTADASLLQKLRLIRLSLRAISVLIAALALLREKTEKAADAAKPTAAAAELAPTHAELHT